MGNTTNKRSGSKSLSELLVGMVITPVVVALTFLLEFGEIPLFAWGIGVFLDVVLAAAILDLKFGDKKEYHSQIKAKGDWLDRVGQIWFLSIFLAPLVNWGISQLVHITAGNWFFVYSVQFLLAGCIPTLTSFSMIRYIKANKHPLVPALIMVVLTMLPVFTVSGKAMDLFKGAIHYEQEVSLPYSEVTLPMNNK